MFVLTLYHAIARKSYDSILKELARGFKGVTFYTKKRKRMKEDASNSESNQSTESEEETHPRQGCVDYSHNTKKAQSYNRALYAIRARVECPFGIICLIFKILEMH